MQLHGIVISFEVDVQVAKAGGGGTYSGCRFSYRDENGALKEKPFHNNVFKFNAGLKTQLSNLKAGEGFVAEVEKEGEYWNWKNIKAVAAPIPIADKDIPATGKTAPYQSPKSTYETPEERANKQLYIIRQSSINQAIEYKGQKATIEDILKVAKQFEAHVFGNDFDDGTLLGMKDDTDGII